MPKLTLIRPADANETAVAWQVAVETRDRPVLLVLTRQDLPTLDRSRHASAEGLRRGAYVVREMRPAAAGASAPTGLLLSKFGFTIDNVMLRAHRLLAG